MQPSHAGNHWLSGLDAAVEVDRRWNIALVTDAWHSQVNGVVSTWTYMQRELALQGQRLQVACMEALKLDRDQARAAVASRTWRAIAKDLLSVLVPLRAEHPTAASGRVRLAPAPAP